MTMEPCCKKIRLVKKVDDSQCEKNDNGDDSCQDRIKDLENQIKQQQLIDYANTANQALCEDKIKKCMDELKKCQDERLLSCKDKLELCKESDSKKPEPQPELPQPPQPPQPEPPQPQLPQLSSCPKCPELHECFCYFGETRCVPVPSIGYLLTNPSNHEGPCGINETRKEDTSTMLANWSQTNSNWENLSPSQIKSPGGVPVKTPTTTKPICSGQISKDPSLYNIPQDDAECPSYYWDDVECRYYPELKIMIEKYTMMNAGIDRDRYEEELIRKVWEIERKHFLCFDKYRKVRDCVFQLPFLPSQEYMKEKRDYFRTIV